MNRSGAMQGRTLRGIAGLLAMVAGIALPVFTVVTHDKLDTHEYILAAVLLLLGYLLLGGNAAHLAEVVRSVRTKK